MLTPRYRYMVFDIEDQKKPAYVGTAKEVARKMYVDLSCIHKAARNRKILMKKYLIIREEFK